MTTIIIIINSILALMGLGCLWAGIWGIKALEEMGADVLKARGLRIFDEQYATLADLYAAVKRGDLLVHCRRLNSDDIEDLQYGLSPEMGETLSGTEATQTAREYGYEPVPLVFASDSFMWVGGGRNGMVFLRKEGFQKSLGDGRVELADGSVVRYEMSPVADHENEALKGEPAGVETGDWYTTKTAEVVAASL